MPQPTSAAAPNGKPSAHSVEPASVGVTPRHAEPLFGDAGLAAMFRDLETAPGVVLAVSGGPDSMALMLMASRWAADRSNPRLHVATVDHGLRAEAAAEAALVSDAAARLGLPHTTLHWDDAKPATRIQERARAARYALLAGFARDIHASHVATAHHADDQAETVLMRLGRGSGLRGLAGMRRQSELAAGISLVRPLLNLAKADLVALCRRREHVFVDDPTNVDPAFARARLRQQAGAAAALGLDRDALVRLARRMSRAEAALEAESLRFEARLSCVHRPQAWLATLTPASDAAPELLQRVLRRALVHVVGKPGHAGNLRLDRLEALADQIHAAVIAERPLRATLGGARIVLSRDASIIVTPEPARRRGIPALAAVKAELPRAAASLGK